MSTPSDAKPSENPSASCRRRRRAVRGEGTLLRTQILAAADELLTRTRSADDLSIRAVAERLAVTAPSIYLHFNDKRHLMQVVAADAFAELDKPMDFAKRSETTPAERLLEYGSAYVAFAQKRPEHYRIALMSPPSARVENAGEDAAGRVLEGLRPIVDGYLADRSLPDLFSLPLTLHLWATAHGVASLLISTPQLPWGDVPTLAERTLCGALHGFHTTKDEPRASRTTAAT